jgi:hypothetical protein
MTYFIKDIEFVHAQILYYEINLPDCFLIIHINNPYDCINKIYLDRVNLKIFNWKSIIVTNYLFANKYRKEQTVEIGLTNDMDFFIEICEVNFIDNFVQIEGFPQGEGWLIYKIESPTIEILPLL